MRTGQIHSKTGYLLGVSFFLHMPGLDVSSVESAIYISAIISHLYLQMEY